MLLNAIEKGWAASGDTDTAFLNGEIIVAPENRSNGSLFCMAEVKAKKAQMDKGIHIGSWGQLQGPSISSRI
jgi:alpha-L-fucosidase 2